MPLDSAFDKDVTIKRIVCILEPLLKDSAAAKDAALFGDFLKVITEGIISIQVGDEVIEYLPLSYCLAKNAIEGDVQYTLATAANGSYGLISAQSVNGEYGLQKEIKVPKTATLKFYLKTKSSVTLANIRMVLETE